MPSLFASLLVTFVHLTGAFSETTYKIWGPDSYVALTGDLTINLQFPTNVTDLRVQLVTVINGQEFPLVRKDVPYKATTLEYPCGLVDRAGLVVFILITKNGDQELARSPVTNVTWPEINAHVPLLLETHTSEVSIHLYKSQSLCPPRMTSPYSVYLDLLYLGKTDTWFESGLVYSQLLNDWSTGIVQEITLDCSLFDQAGFYKVKIRATTATSSTIAQSEPIHAHWSKRFELSVPQPAIEPCIDSLRLVYDYPRCSLGKDRVRVEGRLADGPLSYLWEKLLPKGRYSIGLPCDSFPESLSEFCFSYVTMARNGAVFEHVRQCKPRTMHQEYLHEESIWGDWSAWSPCTASCGIAVQNRYRLCMGSSGNCEGHFTEEQPCATPSCVELSEMPSDFSPNCDCGCAVEVYSTQQFHLADISKCIFPIVWSFSTNSSNIIALRFKRVSLEPDIFWVILRDGLSHVSPVAAIITGDNIPPNLTSESPNLILELHRSNGSTHPTPVLIAEYYSLERPQALKSVSYSETLPVVYLTIIALSFIVLFAIFLMFLVYKVKIFFFKNHIIEDGSMLDEPATSSSDVSGNLAPPPTPNRRFPTPIRNTGKIRRKLKNKRESALPLTKSLSEFSMSEDGFEYDYYDYGFNALPGSYFTHDGSKWPPFIAIPPDDSQCSTSSLHSQ